MKLSPNPAFVCFVKNLDTCDRRPKTPDQGDEETRYDQPKDYNKDQDRYKGRDKDRDKDKDKDKDHSQNCRDFCETKIYIFAKCSLENTI